MRTQVSRRGFIGIVAGAAAALVATARGWTQWRTPLARAAVRWRLLAPVTGQVGACSYHCGACGGAATDPCDNALDFMWRNPPNDTKVKLYVRDDSNVSGYGGVLALESSCSTQDNPSHRRMKYNIATNGFVLLGVGVISHINPTAQVNDLVSGNGGQLGYMNPSGDTFRAGCYEGTHVHFGVLSGSSYPKTMDTLPVNWANANVTAGFHAPWEKYI